MSQVSFDTHAAVRRLERAGCPAPQAEATVSIVMQATGVSSRLAQDVEKLRLYAENNMATRESVEQSRLYVENNMATKDSVEQLRLYAEDNMATKDSVEQLRLYVENNMATKDSVEQLRLYVEDNMATKDSVEQLRLYVEDNMATKDSVERLRLHVENNTATKGDLADLRAEMQSGFAGVNTRLTKLETWQEQSGKNMVTRGDLYRALWIQGGVLGTLILTLASAMVGFMVFSLNTS